MRAFLLTLLAAAALCGACTSNPVLPSATISTMTISGITPTVGTSSQFSAGIVPADGSSTLDVTALATWSSSDPTIATVSRGVVTGVKAGTTTLTVTYNGSTVSSKITINS